ncbi:MAG: Crp/Fnr family transcriptional regulator [Bacteroidia bacterium]|nr:MAG: Crp/Fnr family transcriptional regulator [Bacteroidia bacterium]
MATRNYRNLLNSGPSIIPSTGIFNYLTEEEKASLARHITIMNFARHDIIFKQKMPSDHVVFVTEGLIKVFKAGRGNRLVCISLVGPGNFAGLSSAFGSAEYRFSSSAIENTKAVMIRKEALAGLIKSNGQLAFSLLKLLSRDMLEISDKLVNFSIKQLPGRVADLLRYFSEEIFKTDDFTVPLTRQEMAELIGTTKESLIRTLHEFKNDKIIELDGKRIKIISYDLISILCEHG